MNRIVFTAALAIAMPFTVANAAGPFDGKYEGTVAAVRGTCPTTSGNVTIADGKLTGRFAESKYTFTMTGTVAPDGSMTGTWAGTYPVTGKFTGGHFEGSYIAKLCGGVPRLITLDKTG